MNNKPNKGSFQKGYDPRRQKPITFRNGQVFRELCREKSPELLNMLVGFAQDEEEPTRTRFAVAKWIMEQGYGKAVTAVALLEDTQDIGSMSREDLDKAIMQELLRRKEKPIQGETLDPRGEVLELPNVAEKAIDGPERADKLLSGLETDD